MKSPCSSKFSLASSRLVRIFVVVPGYAHPDCGARALRLLRVRVLLALWDLVRQADARQFVRYGANGIIVTTEYVRDELVRPIVDLPIERFQIIETH